MTDAECNAKIREAAETVKDALWRNRDEGLWVERLWDELDAALAVVPSPPTLAPEIRDLLKRWRSIHRPQCVCGACEDTDALLIPTVPPTKEGT